MTDIQDYTYQYEERTDLKPERVLTEEEQQTLKEVVYALQFVFDAYGMCLGSETYFRLNEKDLSLVFPQWHSQEPINGWDKIEVWDAVGIHKYGYMLPPYQVYRAISKR
jgi:hypothetical protein